MGIFRFILLVTILLFSSYAKELEKVSLQLNWKYQFEFAGFIAAKEKGFYKDTGIDIELKEYQFGMNVVDEVLNSNATFGIGSSTIIKDYLDGKPIVLVSSIFKRSALIIVTKPDIKTPHDLIGKTLMATKPDISELGFMFEKQNIDLKDINIIPHSFNIKDFADGKVDAMSAYKSDQLYKLNKLGVKYNVLDPSDYGVYSLQDEIFTTEYLYETNKDLVERFKEATKKGWEYALNHKSELVDIIYNKYSKNISKDALRDEANIIDNIIFSARYEIGTIDKLFLQKQFNYFKTKYSPSSNRTLEQFLGLDHYTFQNLTDVEKDYLKQKGSIRVCYDKTFYPYTYTQNNSLKGLARDVLDIISKQTKIKFQYVETSNWMEQILYLKQNRCDTTAIMITKPNYYKSLTPSKSYASDQLVLITNINEPYFSSLDRIENKTIGIKYGFKTLKKYLQKRYPKLTFVEIKDDNLNAIIDKKIFGMVSLSLQASATISKYYSNQLKIMTTVLSKEIEGGFGVSKRDPILLAILNKALNDIAEAKIAKVVQKYYKVKVEEKLDTTIIIYGSAIFLTILAIIIFFLLREKQFNAKLEKEIQEAIEQTRLKDQQLVKQNRLAQMGEMISMIAHQWRQPLTAISSSSNTIILKARLNKLSQETTIDLATKITKYTAHLSSTIDDFRDFFKPTKEKSDTTYNEVVKSTLDIIGVSIENNNIQIVKYLESHEILHTYPNDLKQVLLNLLKNSKDAIEENNIEDGYISIETSGRTLIVRDNAGGIPEDIIDKVFDPYFTTKDEKNGTGLGLYMSKMIIEEHCQGTLSVKNGKDGAVFTIEL